MVYIFGGLVKEPVHDITPTFLSQGVLSILRHADHLATQVLIASGYYSQISQMPIILIPIHFDRDLASRQPSCQRSIVIRTIITSDFMTGVPAIPNHDLPADVSILKVTMLCLILFFSPTVVNADPSQFFSSSLGEW